MLQLLMHHVGRTDLTGISNCHVRGLHSIMLHDQEGNRVRLYVTTDDCELTRNYINSNTAIAEDRDVEDDDIESIEEYRQGDLENMSLGLHGHRTAVRLEVLVGQLYNFTATVEEDSENGGMRKYNYTSAITFPGGVTTCDTTTAYRLASLEQKVLNVGDSVYLEPHQLHTVYTDALTSWLVYERGERVEGESVFYSYNHNVPTTPDGNMYQPMSSEECQALLARVIAAHQVANDRKRSIDARKFNQERAVMRLREVRQAISRVAGLNLSHIRSSRATRNAFLHCTGTTGFGLDSIFSVITQEDWDMWVRRVEAMEDVLGMWETDFFNFILTRIAVRAVNTQQSSESPDQGFGGFTLRSTGPRTPTTGANLNDVMSAARSAMRTAAEQHTAFRYPDPSHPSNESPSL